MLFIYTKNGNKKTIFKNLEKQFVSVIKLKPNLCTTYIKFYKNFGRRNKETDRYACFH